MKESTKVFINLDNINSAYSEFSSDETPIIKEELANIILNLSDDKSTKNHVEINIKLKEDASEFEKNQLRMAIRKHNQHEINDNNRHIKRHTLISLLLLLAGLSLALIYYLLPNISNIFLLDFILEVGAWVFIWEFVYMLTIEIPKEYYSNHLYKRIAKSTIKFL